MTANAPVPKAVPVINGRVHTEAVEVNAVHHCNISCRSCSHGSPLMRPWFADPDTVERDLVALLPWMHVDHVRILGGEPLLHPRLPDLLRAVRRTGLGDRRRLLTNGLWLADQPDEFWDEVEEVHVSVYPNTAAHLSRARPSIARMAQRSGTTVLFKYFDHFRAASRPACDHPELTQDIYETCQIANRWRCISVESGRLYRCPQSMLASDARAVVEDGLTISDITTAETVRSWLLRADALRSCGSCTGSVGLLHPHRARTRGDVNAQSDSLDLDFLSRLRVDGDADNGCVSIAEPC
ncbi:radical SAM protein [Trebonia sp.]|uniref:radical SAM protein n=1 Tax=Trebonia sp. TaxID=2767075 RepID=UPI002619D8E0|nr:radical SAM protein [Trebonia sp.]